MIAYTSLIDSTLDPHVVIPNIVETSQAKNKTRQITGVLFFQSGRFLQIIEGDKSQLNFVMDEIQNDPRHHSIEILIDEKTEMRGFSSWTMDAFDFSNGHAYNAEELKRLTHSFKENIQPNSVVLVQFYKLLLAKHSQSIKAMP